MKVLKRLVAFFVLSIFIGLGLLAEMESRPQASRAPLRFEVATVKLVPPDKRPPGGGGGGVCHAPDTKGATSTIPLGHCIFRAATLKQLIVAAFPPAQPLATATNVTSGNGAGFADVAARIRIMPEADWVTGGPNWGGSEFYEVDGKTEDPEHTTQSQLREMLQDLVKERFNLAFHMQPKVLSGYFIIEAKGGMKLKPVADRPTPEENQKLREDLQRKKDAGITPFPVQYGTLTQVAIILTQRLKMPVVTKIDVATRWDFTLLDGVDLGDVNAPDADAVGGSLFSAIQEKAGLKLEPQKIQVEIFVIDHAEKPSEAGQKR